jgi:hypothetical protein
MSRDSAVGIATDNGMNYREVTIRVAVGSRIFSSPRRPHRLWDSLNFLPNVDQYIHSSTRLHGVVLN